MMKLNDICCPFCSCDDLRRYSAPAHDANKKWVNIIECTACNAGWQWPLQRTELQSAMEFGSSYAEHTEGTYFDLHKREAVANCQFEFLRTLKDKPGRLLDIGCGDGHFARYMASRGWDVVGLDPALLRGVSEELSPGRVSLQRHSVSDLPANQVFDVVTLWDVVEHVEQPDQLIDQAAARLALGGMLVVETGNYQSAERIQSQGTWWNYQIDHRWYFAPPQLQALFKQAGLDNIELADRVLRPWWTGQRDMTTPRLMTLAKTVAKKPWLVFAAVRRHRELVQGSKQWKGWGGLEIMTMIGQRPPLHD